MLVHHHATANLTASRGATARQNRFRQILEQGLQRRQLNSGGKPQPAVRNCRRGPLHRRRSAFHHAAMTFWGGKRCLALEFEGSSARNVGSCIGSQTQNAPIRRPHRCKRPPYGPPVRFFLDRYLYTTPHFMRLVRDVCARHDHARLHASGRRVADVAIRATAHLRVLERSVINNPAVGDGRAPGVMVLLAHGREVHDGAACGARDGRTR